MNNTIRTSRWNWDSSIPPSLSRSYYVARLFQDSRQRASSFNDRTAGKKKESIGQQGLFHSRLVLILACVYKRLIT